MGTLPSRRVWDAVESGALAPSALFDLVSIFESEFDFTADTQPGDRFRVLVETRYADGVLVDYGRILAAQYVSDDQAVTGVGFEEKGRFKYFDMEGRCAFAIGSPGRNFSFNGLTNLPLCDTR